MNLCKLKLPNSNPSPPPRQRCRGFVLVVDDDEQNRTLLRDPLEARGYEIVEAENGEQTLCRK